MPSVSVIVPVHNASATLEEALAALTYQDLSSDFEIIVVDDGSTDGSAEIARRFAPRVNVICQDNAGPGPARNRGVAAASGEIIAFTDADCVPTKSWLRKGCDAIADFDMVQGAVRPDPATPRTPFDRTIWVDGRVPLYETANLFVRRQLFERLGGFDDWLKVGIGKPLAEDVWFGWRARRAGASIAFREDVLVYHAVFERTYPALLAERLRLTYFPEIVKQIPELRDEFLVSRAFLNRRTMKFDLALGAFVASLALRRSAPLLLAAPYLSEAVASARRWGRKRAPQVLAGEILADAVGAASLAAGSVRSGSPVL